MPREPYAQAVTIVGPEPHLASCRGCRATLDKPALPMEVARFLRLLRTFERFHSRRCRLPEATARV